MGSQIKPIKTDKDYRNALARVEEIIDAEPGTAEADELEVLTTLVDIYENEHFPMDMPSPVAAIKFRMEQGSFTRRDLEPFMGGKTKVSEVLSGKRSLTLQMIRALHTRLGIPAEVLLQNSLGTLPNDMGDIDWRRFPLTAMAKLGWIPKSADLLGQAEEIMRNLIMRAGDPAAIPNILYRKNEHTRLNVTTDPYALQAWCYQVLATARATTLSVPYRAERINLDFMRSMVRLSCLKDGPKLAKEFLANHGIHLVYVPHLKRTHLDGAAMMLMDGTPVIGLTLRYDRLDNFWFCLCHEIGHIARHLTVDSHALFFDDLRLRGTEGNKMEDQMEREADEWAEEALIPSNIWLNSHARKEPTPERVVELAQELQINPAIIAGRIRYERQNYQLLPQFVGTEKVRKLFQTESEIESIQ